MELTLDKVKDFCFDILGDFVNPTSDLEITQTRTGKFQVIVLRTRSIPKDVITSTWSESVKEQPEFSAVTLFI